MTKLDKLIDLTQLEKPNRRTRLEDKLRQQEYHGDIEELFDSLTKTLITNNETMQALQNKILAALDSNTNALKSLRRQQQNSFLDERAALLTPAPNPPVTLKDDRGKKFAVENSKKLKKNDIDVSLVPDGIKMKGKVYDFSKGFAMFITSKDVIERDKKGDEDKMKLFLKDIGYKQR